MNSKVITNQMILLGLIGIGLNALACDCPMPNLESAKEKADAIFLGTVVGSTSSGNGKSDAYRLVSFSVEKSWKGVRGIKAQVKEGRTTLCSFQFNAGEKYMVFASDTPPTYTHLCSRTKPAEQAREDIEKLGQSIPLK